MITVERLATAPVKSLGLSHPASVRVETWGAVGNRRFVLLDAHGKILDAKRHGRLMSITSESDEGSGRLALTFPDGAVVEGDVGLRDEVLGVDLWGRQIGARCIEGPWSEALSAFAGTRIQVARTERDGDGNDEYPVSLVSLASVQELSRQEGRDDRVDAGRFRMLLELAGCHPHEEDEWLGREVRVGEVVIRVTDHDARCVITTMDPLTGEVDFPTLKTIAAYRGRIDGHLMFGVYAEVVRPGTIHLGDLVEPLLDR